MMMKKSGKLVYNIIYNYIHETISFKKHRQQQK